MKCSSKAEALRISMAGLQKMHGYTVISRSEFLHRVINPNGKYYILVSAGIDPEQMPAVCDCPFYKENKEFGVCKHTLLLEEELSFREHARDIADGMDYECNVRDGVRSPDKF